MVSRHPACPEKHTVDWCPMCAELTRIDRKLRGEHEGAVYYTTDDDGIWVGCNIDDWSVCLGFTPTPDQVMGAWLGHTQEEGARVDPTAEGVEVADVG